MPYGRQVIGAATGYPIQVTADGDPEWKTGGISLDWSTVPAQTADLVLADGVTIPAGQKGIQFGAILTKITASGLYATWSPAFTATTTSGAITAGDTVAPLTAIGANTLYPGDSIHFAGANPETVVVVAVNGLNVTVATPMLAHASGVAVTKPDDGRQTLSRGNCFILNSTVLKTGPFNFGANNADNPAVFFGGRVWKARLQVGGAGQVGFTAFEAAFPRIQYVTV